MLRLIHILTDSNIGGAGILLLNQLRTIDRGLFDLSVILPRGAELAPEVRRIGVRVIEAEGIADSSFSLRGVAALCGILRRESPDAVHCHGALSGRVAALLCRIPVRVYTRHCAYPPPRLLCSFPLKQLCGAAQCRLSNGILAVADAAADNLVEMGVPREKIRVIINGVEPLRELDADERRAWRRSLGFVDGDFVCGIFARLEACKGHRYLLEALALLPRDSRVKVLVVGRGGLEKELRDLAARLGVADRVIFAGFHRDIAPLMNAVDLNLNCSVGTETSSLALSEGMSVGRAAVVSDYGGNPAMIEDGVSGFVVKRASPAALAEAIGRLENDRELLARMSAAARRRFEERFTARKMTEQLEGFYLELWENRKSPAEARRQGRRV